MRDGNAAAPPEWQTEQHMSKHISETMRIILWAGLSAGVLDITSAFIMAGLRGVAPARVLQYIASALLGPKSFQGGAATVALGGALHFLIALAAAAAFYAVSRKVPFLINRPVISGLLYGPIIYTFMNGVVLPLSAVAPKRPPAAADLIVGVVILSCLVGLPIALIVWRSSAAPPPAWSPIN
jgi:uncharacterized membrane protein YagU involved in acid resistance